MAVLAKIGNFCQNPSLSCLLFSFQGKKKVKYDCAMFRLWVWMYTDWDQQPAITFKDAADVWFTGPQQVKGVEKNTQK